MRALILDGAYSRGALAAARSLGRAGWLVGVASVGGRSRAASSRYAARTHALPWPGSGGGAFVSAVAAAVSAEGYEVVLPSADAEILALSGRRDLLHGAFRYPPHETVLRTLDKLALQDAAVVAGVAVPATVAATEQSVRQTRLPVVVKPRLHAASREIAEQSLPVVAESRAEAAAAAAAIRARGAEPVLQELVEGELVAYAVVLGEGGAVAARAQQRAQAVWPARAGGSVRAVSERVDEELERRSLVLLAELGARGLAQLQYIETTAGERFLIDVNIRLYGSIALAIAAGADLPLVWAGSSTGRGPDEPQLARPGVRYHALHGDLKRVASQAGLAGAVADCLRYSAGAAHSVWRWDDPRPAFVYPRQRLLRALRAPRASWPRVR